jgi:hypothetical protein
MLFGAAPAMTIPARPKSLKNSLKIGQKRPRFGVDFFALPPPFWYGFPLESWGPEGLSQTQEK